MSLRGEGLWCVSWEGGGEGAVFMLCELVEGGGGQSYSM